MKKHFLLAGVTLGLGIAFAPQTTLALSPPVQIHNESGLPQLSQIAKDSGLDMKAFHTCMGAGTWTESITRSIADAESLAISGVPETLIFADNGLVYKTFGSDTTALDALLSELKAGKKPSIPPVILPENYARPGLNEPGWGEEKAPVHLVVYVDLACPFCKKYDEALVMIEEKYQGFIQITYRDYPLIGLHPQSFLLAHSAQCAYDQARYWEYLEQLFRWTAVTKQFDTKGLPTPEVPASYQLTETEPGIQSLTVYNWFTSTYVTQIQNLQYKFPELDDEGVMLEVLAEPVSPASARKFVFFKAANPLYKTQPKTNIYKLNLQTGTIERMKISSLLPANSGELQLSPAETKLAWSPVGTGGVAQELYVFDLITDKKTLVKKLPAGQTFDTSDGELLNFSSKFEWLDEKTIGYTAYNAKTKAFITDGIIKLK